MVGDWWESRIVSTRGSTWTSNSLCYYWRSDVALCSARELISKCRRAVRHGKRRRESCDCQPRLHCRRCPGRERELLEGLGFCHEKACGSAWLCTPKPGAF